MSKEFIENRVNASALRKASDQQRQIQYFTYSEVQEEFSTEYWNNWASSTYSTNDYFLKYVRSCFRDENFKTFFQYFRNPNPASGLINDTIIPSLSRVFWSEDSYAKYVIKGQENEDPDILQCESFNDNIFRSSIFRYNDILVHDLKGINMPYRHLVSIDKVVSIESTDSEIHRIAYEAITTHNEIEYRGYVYLDDKVYSFYDSDYNLIFSNPHDLESCPADYIVPYSFSNEDVVRKSIFSHVREKLEEYVFVKTLQKLTETQGAFPTTVKLKTVETSSDDQDNDEVINGALSSTSLGLKKPKKDISMQAGLTVSVPQVIKDDNSLDMDVVDKFFKFFYFPVEILEFINKRVKELESEIVNRLVGSYSEQNESAKNELQVGRSYVSMSDRLRMMSNILSRIVTISDYKMLALAYGKDNVSAKRFFGSDFFLETETEIYDQFEKSPNVIERKNLLKKLSATRNKFNHERSERETLLYDLIPYISDKDFDVAVSKGVDQITFLYQTRFNYWISQLEANFGDIGELMEGQGDETPYSVKLAFINNLIISNIKDYAITNKTDYSPTNNSREAAI